MNRIRLLSLMSVFVFLLCAGFLADTGYAADRKLRVAVPQNPPIVYKDEDGTFKGLAIGVLNSIAENEGWQIQYFSRPLAECFAMLERGDTDLQAGIAFTEERAKKYDYTNETLFSNWGQIYVKQGSKLISILDLHGKKVSLVKKSVHSEALKKLLKGLGVDSTLVEVSNNRAVYKHLKEGKTDAAMTNRTFGYLNAMKYGLEKTEIIFNPIELRYAVLSGSNSDLLVAIDKHLNALKKNPDSIYHQLLAKLFGDIAPGKIPKWLKPTLFFTSIFMLIFLVVILFQRMRVKKKAKEIEERKQIESELRQLNEELQRALQEIKKLQGILPLCSFCKKIRDDKGYWEQVDVYIHKYSDADISHSICPECMKQNYPDEYEEFKSDKNVE